MEIPKDVRRVLPRMFVELADVKITIFLSVCTFGILLYALGKLHNVWLYTIPTLLGPVIGALFFVLRPLNPYQSLYATYSGMERLDSKDPAARRLVLLLRSRRAKLVLLRTGILSSLALCGTAGVILYTVSGELRWSFDLWAMSLLTMIFAILSGQIHCHFLLRWAFRSWNVP